MESYGLGSKTIRAMLSVSEMTEGDVTERRDDRMEGDNFRRCGGTNGRRDVSVTTG